MSISIDLYKGALFAQHHVRYILFSYVLQNYVMVTSSYTFSPCLDYRLIFGLSLGPVWSLITTKSRIEQQRSSCSLHPPILYSGCYYSNKNIIPVFYSDCSPPVTIETRPTHAGCSPRYSRIKDDHSCSLLGLIPTCFSHRNKGNRFKCWW